MSPDSEPASDVEPTYVFDNLNTAFDLLDSAGAWIPAPYVGLLIGVVKTILTTTEVSLSKPSDDWRSETD